MPAVLNPLGGAVQYDAADGEDNRVVLAHTQHFITVDEAASVFLLRLPPAFNQELIEDINFGFSFVLDFEVPVGEILDLPDSRAIIPVVDLMNVPELDLINDYINDFVSTVTNLIASEGLSLDIPLFPFEFTPGFGLVDFDIPAIDLTTFIPDFPLDFFANGGLFDDFLTAFATATNPTSAELNLGDRADTADLTGFDLPTTVNGGTGNDVVLAGLADDLFNGEEGDDTFVMNPEADGVLKVFNGGPGVDTLLLNLTTGNDDLELRQNGSDLEILFNGLTQTYRLIDVESIQIKGNAGNDNFIFNMSGGAVPVPLDVHAGDGEDRIVTTGDSAPTSNNVYIAKISSLSGRSEITMGGVTQQMFFEQFDEQNEFFSDELPGSLDVHSLFLGSSIFVGASETPGFGVISDGVDGPVRFANKDALTVHGNSHGDEFVVDTAGLPPTLDTLTLLGFSSEDSVLLLGSDGADSIRYEATGGGEATIAFSGGANLDVNLDAFEMVVIDALEGNDNLEVVTDNAVITLGGSPGTGTIESFAGSDALLAVEYADINNPVDVNGSGTAIVVGSEADDAFDVAGGLVTSFNPFGAANLVNVSSFNTLAFDLGAGSDVVQIAQSSLFPGGIQIAGGEPGAGSDAVVAQATGAVLLDVGAGTLGGVVGGAITLGGVEELTVQGATSLQVNDYGLPTSLGHVLYDGGNSLAVNLTTGPDSVTFTPTGAASATIHRTASDPVLDLVNFTNAAGGVEINGGGGPDALVFVGTDAADEVSVTQDSGQVDVTLRTGGVDWVPVRFEEIESLRVEGRDGSDRFNVEPGEVSVFVDGGTPVGATGDRLILTADRTAVYEPGPELDSGGFTIDDAQIVSFDNVEEFELNDVSGSNLIVTVKGTGGDDHLSAVGVRPGEVDLTVNNEKVLDYNGVAEVHLVGLNGTDDIDIDVNVANLGVEFFVRGGLPVNGDTLTLTGVDGAADNPVWTPNAVDGGVFVLSGVTVHVAEIETLSYDGEADNEALEGQGQADADTFVHTPGVTVDAGNLAVDSLLAITYVHLGAGGTVTVAGLSGADTLVVFGTGGVDAFALTFPGANQADIDLTDAAGVHVDLLTTAVESYMVRALEGDDRVGVQAPVNISGSLALQGGEPDSGSDVFTVTLTGGAFDATVAPNLPTSDALVTGVGAPIPIDGFERIWFDNSGDPADDTLTVQTGVGDHVARVENAASGGDEVTSDFLPVVQFVNLDTFRFDDAGLGIDVVTFVTSTLDGATNYETDLGGRDTVVIEGNDAFNDSWRVSRAAGVPLAVTDQLSGVTITDRSAVPISLRINGLNGDDAVTVDVDAAGGSNLINIPITFDGGLGTDRLTVQGTPGTAVGEVIYSPGPALGAGRLDYQATPGGASRLMLIDFVGLEPVVDLVPSALLTVNGSNAANAITYRQGSVVGRGLIAVDGQETIEFSNKTTLTLDGQGGNDTLTVEHSVTAPTGLTTVNVNGGAATGDAFTLRGTAAADTVSYTANAGDGGQLVVNGIIYNVTLVETASVNAVDPGAGDTLTVTTASATIIPGATPGTGTVRPVELLTGTALLALDYAGFESATVTGTTAVIQGTAANDIISVLLSGIVEVTNLLGFVNSVNVAAFTTLVVNALGGDDTINVQSSGLFTGGITVVGGEPGAGSDLVSIVNDPNPTIDFNTNQVSGVVGGPITLSGIETLSVNGSDGTLDAFTVLGYGMPTDVRTLNLGGGDTNNDDGDTIDVTATASVDTIRYTSLSVSTARLERLEGGPVLNVAGFNNADNNFSFNGGGNVNELINVAPAGNDLTQVIQGGLGTRVTVTANGAAGGGVKWVPIDFVGVNALDVDAGAGNDRIDIDNTGGLVTLAAGINVDGGNGRDTLRLLGQTAVDLSRYTPGPEDDQGTVIHTLGAAAQQVFFVNLEPVIDLVAGPLVLDGTNADNAINYTAGPNSGIVNVLNPAGLLTGQVTVDGFESYEFANKATLTLNALAGSDTVNLNNPTLPAGLTAITVNGGDATASDRVIINGTTALNAIVVDQLTADGARVTGAQPVPVTVATTEHLTIDGRGGNDTLNIITPAGGDVVSLTDGTLSDRASLDVRASNGDARIPIDFTTLGFGGSLTISSVGGREDVLVVNASDQANLNSIFTVSTGGTVTLASPAFPAPTRELVDVLTSGVTILRLNAFDGDDTFNVASNHPFADVVLLGAEPDGNDTLNVTGGGAAQTVSLAANTITETGFGAIHLTGIETVNLNAAAANVSVTATAADDRITASPTTADAVALVLAGRNTVWHFSSVGFAFSVDALGGSDRLTVNDLESGDTILVNGTTVSVTLPVALQPINHVNFESLTVNGNDGNDTLDVTPAAGLPMFLDGGTAIGATAGDRIILRPPAAFTIEPGPENDSGGLNSLGFERVSWDGIEAAAVVGPGPGTLLGTNGDDDITIIARDSTYDPLADGVQDYTVSLNDGPDFLIVNVGTFSVDARSGDDSVVVRAPAPAAAGPWNVQLNLSGGEPAAGGLPQSDRFVLVTPGTTSVVYTPTPGFPDRGTFLIDQGGLNSLITLAPLPGSTSGGFEFTQYDGEDGNDTLTLNTPAADDVTTFQQTASDAGSFTFFSGGLNLLPLAVSDLGSAATINLTDAGGGGDRFIHRGTPGDDTFAITTVPATSLTIDAGTPIVSTGVELFSLDGLAGSDTMTFLGSAVVENYTFNNQGGHVQMLRDVDAVDVEMTSLERAEVSMLGGADVVLLNNLRGTDLQALVLDLGADAVQDLVQVEGWTGVENLRVSGTAGVVIVDGLSHSVTLRNPTTTDFLRVRGNEGDDLILTDAEATGRIRVQVEGGAGNDAIGGPGILSGGSGNDVIDLSRVTNPVQLNLDIVGAGQPTAGVGVITLDAPGELFRGTPFTDTLWVRPLLIARSIDGVGGFDTINLDTFGSPALLTASTAFVSGFAPVSFTNVANINFVGDSIVNVSPLIRTLNVNRLKFNKRRNRWVMHILLRNFSDKLTLGGPFYMVLEKLPPGVRVLNMIGTANRVSTTGGPVVRVNVLDDGKLGPGEVVGVEIEFRGTPRGLRALKQNAFSAVTYAGPGRV